MDSAINKSTLALAGQEVKVLANGNKVSRMDYLGRFLDGVDFVLRGRKGGIIEDRWLVRNYDPHFSDIITKHLEHQDPRVRSETVLLLAELRERAALEKVKWMRRNDKEMVAMSCLAYLNRVEEADDLVPQLLEVLRSGRGEEFRRAAVKMKSMGRAEDIEGLREIFGGLRDERATLLRDAMESIISRSPELDGIKDLLLSKPVFPNEDAYSRFLDKALDYIGTRYKETISPRGRINLSTYKNIIKALGEIRIRLYNEEDNLVHYHPADVKRHQQLVDLLEWAYSDLGRKEVVDSDQRVTMNRCPECGNDMRFHNGGWLCVECGYRSR